MQSIQLEATRASHHGTLLSGLEPPTSRLTAERASQLRHKSYYWLCLFFQEKDYEKKPER
ncbi:hypothetical protein H8356DRAFT_1325615 [Neocallimastix lanati (nom. inval.)]|nr:hypothetical protein H8356DRAFT_1325615 [Neocallimastix sp. JGI-2020a]